MSTIKEVLYNRVVNGWNFKLVESEDDYIFYECRGDVMYDDEHDEIPEPSLWRAAMQLENDLLSEGYIAEANHSEKGWVEVTITDIYQ